MPAPYERGAKGRFPVRVLRVTFVDPLCDQTVATWCFPTRIPGRPAVVAPQGILSAAVNGDLESSAVATREASAACARAGFVVNLPGPVQGMTVPCP